MPETMKLLRNIENKITKDKIVEDMLHLEIMKNISPF